MLTFLQPVTNRAVELVCCLHCATKHSETPNLTTIQRVYLELSVYVLKLDNASLSKMYTRNKSCL